MKKSFVLMFLLGVPVVYGAGPFITLRLCGGHTDGGPFWQKTAENILRNRAVCDEVTLATGIGYPPLSWHAEQSRRHAAAAEMLRKEGKSVGVQFDVTLGQGDAVLAEGDCSGKTWRGFTGPTGIECRHCSCPRQPDFLEYIAEMARLYAAWKPSTVWIGDDLRIGDRHPASVEGANGFDGCFCEVCVAVFSSIVSAPYDRISLVAALGNDAELLKRWERFNFMSLALVAKTIASAVHEVSPETTMGYQHRVRFDGMLGIVFDSLADASGHPVLSRSSGDMSVTDHQPYAPIENAFVFARQMKALADCHSVKGFSVGIDTHPHTFNCRTARSIVAEAFANLALGMDSLGLLIVDTEYERPDWYGERLFTPLAAAMPQFREYERINRGTMPGGLNSLQIRPPRFLASAGMPLVTGPTPRTCGTILTAADAEEIPEAELESLFEHGVLLDGQAAQVIVRRGLDKSLLGGLKVRMASHGVREVFTDDSFNAGFESRRSAGMQKFVLVPMSENVRSLGRYLDAYGADGGISTLCGDSPRGGRFAILGCGGFALEDASSDQLRRLHRMADFVSGGRLPVVLEDPIRAVVVARVAEDGSLRSLFALNVSIDENPPVRVRLRGLPLDVRAEWVVSDGTRSGVELRHEGTETFATIPKLAPWRCGWMDFPGTKPIP